MNRSILFSLTICFLILFSSLNASAEANNHNSPAYHTVQNSITSLRSGLDKLSKCAILFQWQSANNKPKSYAMIMLDGSKQSAGIINDSEGYRKVVLHGTHLYIVGQTSVVEHNLPKGKLPLYIILKQLGAGDPLFGDLLYYRTFNTGNDIQSARVIHLKAPNQNMLDITTAMAIDPKSVASARKKGKAAMAKYHAAMAAHMVLRIHYYTNSNLPYAFTFSVIGTKAPYIGTIARLTENVIYSFNPVYQSDTFSIRPLPTNVFIPPTIKSSVAQKVLANTELQERLSRNAVSLSTTRLISNLKAVSLCKLNNEHYLVNGYRKITQDSIGAKSEADVSKIITESGYNLDPGLYPGMFGTYLGILDHITKIAISPNPNTKFIYLSALATTQFPPSRSITHILALGYTHSIKKVLTAVKALKGTFKPTTVPIHMIVDKKTGLLIYLNVLYPAALQESAWIMTALDGKILVPPMTAQGKSNVD